MPRTATNVRKQSNKTKARTTKSKQECADTLPNNTPNESADNTIDGCGGSVLNLQILGDIAKLVIEGHSTNSTNDTNDTVDSGDSDAMCDVPVCQDSEQVSSPNRVDPHQEELMQQLRQFIDQNALKNCVQRSAEWYKMRQFSFGGSEISNLMSICKKRYVTQQQFLCDKYMAQSGTGRGIDPKKQLIMDWGTFFEPVHRDVIQDIFKVSIYETSMCPAKGILQGSHQSPDGLTVVRTSDFLQNVSCHDIVDKSVFDKEYLTILIEQKCPYYRKPIKEMVPDHYIGQIKLGLSVFTVCDIGCFSDSLIRVCTHRQLFNKAYNQGILKQIRQETPDPDPVYIGLIVFSQKSQQLMNLQPGDVSSDFTDSRFAQMMDLLRGGQIETETIMHRFSQDIKQQVYDSVKRLAKEGKSFICWKLVGLTFTSVERSKGFDSVLSIFISLGKKVLAKYAEMQDIPSKEMQEIGQFSTFIQKLAMPLTAGNHQDAWFRKNQQQIISKFEELFMDDWQSFYVLLSLMLGANESSLKEKAKSYISRAQLLCQDDQIKAQLLNTLILELQQSLGDF